MRLFKEAVWRGREHRMKRDEQPHDGESATTILKTRDLEREIYLSVSTGENAQKIKEIEERERELQTIISGLVSENMMLKKRVQELENAVAEIRQRLLQRIEELEKKQKKMKTEL